MIATPWRLVALVQRPHAHFEPRVEIVHGLTDDGRLVHDSMHLADALVAFADVSGSLAGHVAIINSLEVYGSIGSAREALRRTSARFIAGRHDIAVPPPQDSFAIPEPALPRQGERIGE